MACIPGVNFVIFEHIHKFRQSWAIPDDWKKEDISLIKGSLYYKGKRVKQNNFWSNIVDSNIINSNPIHTIIISDCEVLQYDYDIYAEFSDGVMTDAEIQEWVNENIASI
jgi:hypothetical protein